MASATAGSTMKSYKLATGSCDDMMIDLYSCLSSMMSSRMEALFGIKECEEGIVKDELSSAFYFSELNL